MTIDRPGTARPQRRSGLGPGQQEAGVAANNRARPLYSEHPGLYTRLLAGALAKVEWLGVLHLGPASKRLLEGYRL